MGTSYLGQPWDSYLAQESTTFYLLLHESWVLHQHQPTHVFNLVRRISKNVNEHKLLQLSTNAPCPLLLCLTYFAILILCLDCECCYFLP